MAVSRPIFKLTPSDWSTSWWRAPPSENQFDNLSKFMVPMLLNFPEDSWVAIDNLTKDRLQFCLCNFPRLCIPALDMTHIIWVISYVGCPRQRFLVINSVGLHRPSWFFAGGLLWSLCTIYQKTRGKARQAKKFFLHGRVLWKFLKWRFRKF